jgi:hypothetical protein
MCSTRERFVEIINAPTADVVEVVRCGECEHWKGAVKDILLGECVGYCHNNDFPFHCEERPITRETYFCGSGERRDT